MNGYLSFVLANRRLLAFGLLMAFFSSFGQTFFIALSGAEIRADFQLSHSGFGTIYSLATLVSAACLIWLGPRIDDLDLRLFSCLVCLGLAAACLTMAAAGQPALLFAALLLLRLMGQGLLSHTAVTTMGRYFDRQRGKAIGFASLGHAGGEALLPLPMVLLMGAIGWQRAWLAIGIALALGLVPLVLWLLKDHGERHRRLLEEQAREGGSGQTPTRRHWTRREVLGDRWFYRVLPSVLACPFIMTGLFFHQAHLAETKGWSLAWVATCFAGFAASSVAGSLGGGALVDRLGAVRLLAFFLLPLAGALVLLALADHPATALGYLVLAGLSAGLNFSVAGSLWAEVYGVLHLGSIRALLSALMVFSTALSPVVLGGLIDLGVSMEAIAGLCLAYVGVAVGLVALPGGRPGV